MNKQVILLSYLIIFIFLFSGVNTLASNLSDKDTKAMNFIKMDSDYSYQMMDATTNFAQKSKLFFDLKNQYLQEGDINLGISFIGLADYQRTNRKSKFSYLMRLPNSGNQVGKEMSEVVVNSVQIQTSGAFTSWGAFYSELLYNPQRNFGAGTISSASRNLTQISQAYVVFGDKDQYPFYASLGKQNVPFGLMDTANPFTMSMTWHAFAPVAYSAIFGVDTHGLNISAVAVQGGAQFRAANTPVKETNAPSLINNYVGDINYTYSWQEDYSVMVGTSYLRGSTYNQEFPVAHFAPGKLRILHLMFIQS
ncbi:MAG: hypothetical protein HRU35_06965 [Rickettsiaceae bacterium]|nr:hypothetical protein [Rickettsiaceae bacterium]